MMAAPLLSLTEDARTELERYLRRVRATLRAHPSVDAEEVERDIRGHIDAELAESPAPVTEFHLRAVLDRLGSPSQWVPADDLPGWRKVLARLRSGPQDWRLAYASCALFIASPLVRGSLGGGLFLASILLARAAVELLEEEGEPVGARRWLLYPPLVVIDFAIAAALLLGPPAMLATAGDPTVRAEAATWLPAPFWLSLASAVGVMGGIWWTMLGLVLVRFPRAMHFVFYPFADWFERRHAIRLALTGLVVALAAGVGLIAAIR